MVVLTRLAVVWEDVVGKAIVNYSILLVSKLELTLVLSLKLPYDSDCCILTQ